MCYTDDCSLSLSPLPSFLLQSPRGQPLQAEAATPAPPPTRSTVDIRLRDKKISDFRCFTCLGNRNLTNFSVGWVRLVPNLPEFDRTLLLPTLTSVEVGLRFPLPPPLLQLHADDVLVAVHTYTHSPHFFFGTFCIGLNQAVKKKRRPPPCHDDTSVKKKERGVGGVLSSLEEEEGQLLKAGRRATSRHKFCPLSYRC